MSCAIDGAAGARRPATSSCSTFLVTYHLTAGKKGGSGPSKKKCAICNDGVLKISETAVNLLSQDRAYIDGEKCRSKLAPPPAAFTRLCRANGVLNPGDEVQVGRHTARIESAIHLHLLDNPERLHQHPTDPEGDEDDIPTTGGGGGAGTSRTTETAKPPPRRIAKSLHQPSKLAPVPHPHALLPLHNTTPRTTTASPPMSALPPPHAGYVVTTAEGPPNPPPPHYPSYYTSQHQQSQQQQQPFPCTGPYPTNPSLAPPPSMSGVPPPYPDYGVPPPAPPPPEGGGTPAAFGTSSEMASLGGAALATSFYPPSPPGRCALKAEQEVLQSSSSFIMCSRFAASRFDPNAPLAGGGGGGLHSGIGGTATSRLVVRSREEVLRMLLHHAARTSVPSPCRGDELET